VLTGDDPSSDDDSVFRRRARDELALVGAPLEFDAHRFSAPYALTAVLFSPSSEKPTSKTTRLWLSQPSPQSSRPLNPKRRDAPQLSWPGIGGPDQRPARQARLAAAPNTPA